MIRGVQGAVALRRQRSRRDDHRRMTNASLDGLHGVHAAPPSSSRQLAGDGKSRGSVFGTTFFHIGLVLLFIGFMMVITALIPGYISKTKTFDLVGTGTFFVIVGGVMTLINRAITKQEDHRLERYVSDRLARSKSGCLLVRDEEVGYHHPVVHRRSRRPSRSPRLSTHGDEVAVAAAAAAPGAGSGTPSKGDSSSHGRSGPSASVDDPINTYYSSLSEIPEESSVTSAEPTAVSSHKTGLSKQHSSAADSAEQHHRSREPPTPAEPRHRSSSLSTPTKTRHTRGAIGHTSPGLGHAVNPSGHSDSSPVGTHRARVTHVEHGRHVSQVTQVAHLLTGDGQQKLPPPAAAAATECRRTPTPTDY